MSCSSQFWLWLWIVLFVCLSSAILLPILASKKHDPNVLCCHLPVVGKRSQNSCFRELLKIKVIACSDLLLESKFYFNENLDLFPKLNDSIQFESINFTINASLWQASSAIAQLIFSFPPWQWSTLTESTLPACSGNSSVSRPAPHFSPPWGQLETD